MSWLHLVWVATAARGGDPAEPKYAREPFAEEEKRGHIQVEPVDEIEAPTVVLSGGTVMTANGDIFEAGYVVLEKGLIVQVGEGAAPAYAGAKVVDTTGRFVTPGLIDSHSHLGVYPAPDARAHGDGNEATHPTTPGVWAEHSFWPQDPGLERAMAGGITSLQVLPGSANLIGGRGLVLHLVPHRGSRAMRFPGAPDTLKMACGENPKRVYGEKGGPSTRMGNLRGQREAFLDAEAYRQQWRRYLEELQRFNDRAAAGPADKKKKGEESPKSPDLPPLPPGRDLDKETLVGVLDGRILPEVHCYRADDMLTFMQVAEEFGFRVRSFHHALEAYKIRDVLAKNEISVSTWADWWGFKLEAWDGIPYSLALVTEAGGRGVVHSDSDIGIQRLNQEAGKARRYGQEAGIAITADQALRWVTVNPAWTLGIDDQVGTLQVGKRGDVVVWNHDPFSVYARADLVFVDGILRYDAEHPDVWSDFEVGTEVTP